METPSVELRVFARHELIDCPPKPGEPVLLLEGSWPPGVSGGAHASLDDAIDGRRDWIDEVAADWAAALGEDARPPDGAGPSPAYLNALPLRYYLVKLLRLPAYFADVQPLEGVDGVELVAATGRDRDYADVLVQLCRAADVPCHVRWMAGRQRAPQRFPRNPPWRRWAGRLLGGWNLGGWGKAQRCPRASQTGAPLRFAPATHTFQHNPAVVLCGNPRLLDPVCRQLLRQGCRPAWLYDRFALRSWLRWRTLGVRQLACDSSLGREIRLPQQPLGPDLSRRLVCRGVNLAGPIRRWLIERTESHGPRQTRLIEQIDVHFRRVRPHAVVLDEDATPMARAVVAVARRHGARSFVVQHGVPCCRFGFAPAAADRVLVWGRSSELQLLDWGVPAEQIRVTGSPQHDPKTGTVPVLTGGAATRGAVSARSPLVAAQPRHLFRQNGRSGDASCGKVSGPPLARPPRILLLATVPPRDERPDSVALHLTGRSYVEMLRMAFATVAGIDAVEMTVKLHPRTVDDPAIRALRSEFSSLRCRVVRRGPLPRWFDEIDCVLSCGSTAGVEAAMAGLPVIQLVPSGATGFPPHDRWGLAGTARCENELQRLLVRVLVEGWRPARWPDPDVLAAGDRPAAARVVDEILQTPPAEIPSHPPSDDHVRIR